MSRVAKEENEHVEENETFVNKLGKFVMSQSLPIGTMFSIILGIFVPRPAVYLSERIPIVQVCIMVLFFCIGLRLRFQEAKSAVKCYKENFGWINFGSFCLSGYWKQIFSIKSNNLALSLAAQVNNR